MCAFSIDTLLALLAEHYSRFGLVGSPIPYNPHTFPKWKGRYLPNDYERGR